MEREEVINLINEAILLHEHNGNDSKQVDYFNVFDAPLQYLQFEVFGAAIDTATGDGKYYLHIPEGFDNLAVQEVHALVAVAGVTDLLNVQIHNLTNTTNILETALTIDTTEVGSDTATAPAVIDDANNAVKENDILRIDVDAVHSGTAAKGLIITLGFK